MAYAYYIPNQKQVLPPNTHPDIVAFLYATYMKHLPPEQEPDSFDGVSQNIAPTTLESRVILVLNRKVSVLLP
jgi:hypothetical protein